MAEIRIDSLSEAIASECRFYAVAVRSVAKKTVITVAKEAAEKLKQTSPVGTNYKRQRHYRDGWRVKSKELEGKFSATIHNETDWQLTHLLEYGHALPQGGRARAYPHIKLSEEWANSEALRRLEEELSEID